MGRNRSNRKRARATVLDDDVRKALSKFVHYLGRATRRWKDEDYIFRSQLLGVDTRVVHRTYFDDLGKPCGCALRFKESFPVP